MSILSIGEILIDFTPVEGMEHSYTANPGGAPANVAVSVARNGSISGGLCVTKHGGIPALPTIDEIEKALS